MWGVFVEFERGAGGELRGEVGEVVDMHFVGRYSDNETCKFVSLLGFEIR